jgi:hypothetical protein
MTLKVCNVGKTTLQQLFKATLNTYVLRLYQNNHTPAITDTAANYTEATFTGYAAINLVSWGNAFLNGSSISEMDEIARTFTQTGVGVTNNIYGYYVTDGAGVLIWAELNPNGVFNMNNTGLTYTVQPILTLANADGT